MRCMLVVPIVIFLLAGTCLADEQAAVSQAQAAAIHWLTLTDAVKYGSSWDEAASLFQTAVTKANWESALKGARGPLGIVKSID